MKKKIRILSSNSHKLKEIQKFLEKHDIEVVGKNIKLEELQTEDLDVLVKDKALKAYREIGRPLIVEHTGLFLERINGLPGGLTQIFWDKLGVNNFAKILGAPDASSKAVATTVLCYVDGKKFNIFKGEIQGCITNTPKGDFSFQWDCVFIPEGFDKTFAEMSVEEKNKISMRGIALSKFVEFINKDE